MQKGNCGVITLAQVVGWLGPGDSGGSFAVGRTSGLSHHCPIKCFFFSSNTNSTSGSCESGLISTKSFSANTRCLKTCCPEDSRMCIIPTERPPHEVSDEASHEVPHEWFHEVFHELPREASHELSWNLLLATIMPLRILLSDAFGGVCELGVV